MPRAWVKSNLNCQGCGAHIITDGRLTCLRCHQPVNMTSESDVIIDEQGRWKCQKCLECDKRPKTLAVGEEIRCRFCKTKNFLVQKEEKMSDEKEEKKERERELKVETGVKDFPVQEAKAFGAKAEEEYRKHEIYYIEDTEERMWAPAHLTAVRVKYVYRRTLPRMAVTCERGEVQLVTEKEILKNLEKAVQDPTAFKDTFVRKLSEAASFEAASLFDLAIQIHNTECSLRRERESLERIFERVTEMA